jgi:hypothetical protein
MEINRIIELIDLFKLEIKEGKDEIIVTGRIKPNQEQTNEIEEKRGEIIAELKRRTTDAERAKKQEIVRLTELAKLTGEKQLLERWMEDCSDPEKEWNVDVISKYIMPDGSLEIERYPTW